MEREKVDGIRTGEGEKKIKTTRRAGGFLLDNTLGGDLLMGVHLVCTERSPIIIALKQDGNEYDYIQVGRDAPPSEE